MIQIATAAPCFATPSIREVSGRVDRGRRYHHVSRDLLRVENMNQLVELLLFNRSNCLALMISGSNGYELESHFSADHRGEFRDLDV